MKTKDYSPIYRIMHWAIATCILLLLVTIFLRLTWMNKSNMAEIIENYLSTTDQSLSYDQAIMLAKKIRQPMWDWHLYFGYVLVGLFSIRMFLPLFGQMKFSSPFDKSLSMKEKFQNWVYLIFYACVATSLITGLVIVFGPRDIKHSMETVHVLSIYYLLAYIVIHFTGILWAEMTNQKGVISKMFSGK